MKPRLRSVLSLLLVALPVLLGAAPPTAPLPPASTAPEAQRWPGAVQHVARLAAAVRAQARRAPAKALVDLYRLHNFSALHAAAEALDGAATALATAPRIPPLVADHARDVRARLSTTDGDGGAPGIATAGWWIGPFDNPAGGGHATAHAPEQPGAARLDWHALTLVPRDGRLSLRLRRAPVLELWRKRWESFPSSCAGGARATAD